MCVQALPLILSAAGTGISLAGQARQRNEQARIARETEQQQRDIQGRAGQQVTQEIQKVAAANPDAERKAAQDDFLAALRKSKTETGGADFGAPGGTSDRFAADVGTTRANASAEGKGLAGNLAAIDAPQYARVNEGRGIVDTATALDLLKGESSADNFLAQLRAARASRAGSGLETLGSGLSAFGNAYAGREQPAGPGGTTSIMSPAGIIPATKIPAKRLVGAPKGPH